MLSVAPSERFNYRLLNSDDANLLQELDSDPAVMKYINGGSAHSLEDIKEIYIPRMQAYTNAEQGWGLWGVFEKQNNHFLGWILVRPYDFFGAFPDFDNLELGWRFKQATWGKGVGTEAATAILNALKAAGHARKYSAIAMESNTGSINIMKKLGLRYQDTRLYKDEIAEETVVYYELTVQ